MNNNTKYVKPELKAHGSVEDVTQATYDGDPLDGNWTLNTPLSDPIAHYLS